MTVIGAGQCQQLYEGLGYVYEHNICAGDLVNGGKDACTVRLFTGPCIP